MVCHTGCPFPGFSPSQASPFAPTNTEARRPGRAAPCREPAGPAHGPFLEHIAAVASVLAVEVFSNEMFLSCLLAYILLWNYRSLVSNRVLRRHKERLPRRRYSTLREENKSCFCPLLSPGNGRHGGRLAEGRPGQNRSSGVRKQGLTAGAAWLWCADSQQEVVDLVGKCLISMFDIGSETK